MFQNIPWLEEPADSASAEGGTSREFGESLIHSGDGASNSSESLREFAQFQTLLKLLDPTGDLMAKERLGKTATENYPPPDL
jgi:hypothetical protein